MIISALEGLEFELRRALEYIQQAEDKKDYASRNHFIKDALGLANHLQMQTGIRIDPAEPEWPVVYIELPTGQVSWHLPQHEKPWDGHTTEEKYERITKWFSIDAG